MEKLLLVLLLKEQLVFKNKYLSLLDVKTKKEYTNRLFLQKKNALYWSLCKKEIKNKVPPVYCWKLKRQWTNHYRLKQHSSKSILSLLNRLCTKNVTQITSEEKLLQIRPKEVSSACYEKSKYILKTMRYRRSS